MLGSYFLVFGLLLLYLVAVLGDERNLFVDLGAKLFLLGLELCYLGAHLLLGLFEEVKVALELLQLG